MQLQSLQWRKALKWLKHIGILLSRRRGEQGGIEGEENPTLAPFVTSLQTMATASDATKGESRMNNWGPEAEKWKKVFEERFLKTPFDWWIYGRGEPVETIKFAQTHPLFRIVYAFRHANGRNGCSLPFLKAVSGRKRISSEALRLSCIRRSYCADTGLVIHKVVGNNGNRGNWGLFCPSSSGHPMNLHKVWKALAEGKGWKGTIYSGPFYRREMLYRPPAGKGVTPRPPSYMRSYNESLSKFERLTGQHTAIDANFTMEDFPGCLFHMMEKIEKPSLKRKCDGLCDQGAQVSGILEGREIANCQKAFRGENPDL
jgi:hypothetical protein